MTPRRYVLVLVSFLALAFSLWAEDNPASVRWELDYHIGDSVDNIGNLYIQAWSRLPTALTFVNGDGSVSVAASDEDAHLTRVYEYNADLVEQRTLSIQNPLGGLGAFTKDNEGNYYFFYAAPARSQSAQNMAMIKINSQGETLNAYYLNAKPQNSFNGVRVPFHYGTCRLELSGSMLAVYFAREMFDGHQASYGFVLDKDSFERIDAGSATNARIGGETRRCPM